MSSVEERADAPHAMNIRTIRLLPAVLALFTSIALAAEEGWAPRPEDVTVIHTEQNVMYKYRDADGNMVVQGQPPPGFLNPRKANAEAAPVEEAMPIIPNAVSKPVERVEPPVAPWILVSFAVLLLLMGVAVLLWQPVRRFFRESPLERVVRKSGYPAFSDVVLPGHGAGERTIEHVLHTPSGLLLLSAPEISGIVTGGHDLPSWSCGTKTDRQQTPNPVLENAKSVEAVRQLVGNVPVFGRVVMTRKVSFPLRPPAEVLSLQTLKHSLPEFAVHPAAERELGGAWRLLMRYPRSADTLRHAPGVGAGAWMRRHRSSVAGGFLLLLGVSAAALAAAFSV